MMLERPIGNGLLQLARPTEDQCFAPGTGVFCRHGRAEGPYGAEEEDPMSRPAGSFTASVFAGAVCLAGCLSISAMAQGVSPPDFTPNSSAGWFAYTRQFIPPASGAGPVRPDPAHRGVSNDEFRATGRQPALAVADLNNPILQPWARDKVR